MAEEVGDSNDCDGAEVVGGCVGRRRHRQAAAEGRATRASGGRHDAVDSEVTGGKELQPWGCSTLGVAQRLEVAFIKGKISTRGELVRRDLFACGGGSGPNMYKRSDSRVVAYGWACRERILH